MLPRETLGSEPREADSHREASKKQIEKLEEVKHICSNAQLKKTFYQTCSLTGMCGRPPKEF